MNRKFFAIFLCIQIILGLLLFGTPVSAVPDGVFQISDADLNKDNAVNMKDIMLLVSSFNSAEGDARYNAAYDLNHDNAINLIDIMMIARYFNQTVTPVSPTPSTGNNPPIGTFTVWPNVVNTGATANFYASASYDTDGTITDYSWDFGDGTTATGANTNHKYTNTGNYDVKLTVTDNSGLKSTFTQTVSVPLNSGGGSTDKAYYGFEDGTVNGFSTNNSSSIITNTTTKAYAGTNSLKWDINSAAAAMYEFKKDNMTLKPGTKMVFRLWIPSGAPITEIQPYIMPHDPSWSIALWNADWRGYDGIQKDAWNEFAVTLPSDTDPTLPCQVGVQIKTGGTGNFTIYADSIDWPQGSIPPKASFDYTPDRPNAEQVVSFDAVNSTDKTLKSTDQDGTISSFEWDFGDGEKGTGSTVTHTYKKAGKYAVTLTVKDNDGLTNCLTRVVWCGQTEKFAPPLKVSGTKIVDSNGDEFIPKGLAIIDSLTFTKADFAYMKKEFKINAIRLPYITDRWYYNTTAETREAYLKAYDNYLDWTYELGIYVLFDGWHEGGQGDEKAQWDDCVTGWNILAARCKNRTHIIWEVYNEPNKSTWTEWAPKAEQLIDIIKSYNPVVNVFAVPGINWAQEIDARTRPINREGVVYSVHPYPQVYNGVWTPETWDSKFGYIVKEGIAPVINTEYMYPLFDKGDSAAYGKPIIKYQADRGIGWFGWIFGGWGGPLRDPSSNRTECYQLFWENMNGIWVH